MECECGCGRAVEVVRENEQPDQPYQLCETCATRLKARALRPLEWYRLASLHSPWKHDLHDDFYSAAGRALQPEVDVVREKGLMRAPNLRDASRSVERLFEFAYTRHFLEPRVAEAFGRFAPEEVRSALEPSLQGRKPNTMNVVMACGIAAEVLGPQAVGFVRRGLTSCTVEAYAGFAYAASSCLPREESLGWALGFLDALDAKERGSLKDALIPFGDVRVLDWIEAHASEIEMARAWQRLAAYSAFTWERAQDWLRRGRPLSLVALGALRESMGLENGGLLPGAVLPPRPALPPVPEVLGELYGYLERDGSRNARDQVGDLHAFLVGG